MTLISFKSIKSECGTTLNFLLQQLLSLRWMSLTISCHYRAHPPQWPQRRWKIHIFNQSEGEIISENRRHTTEVQLTGRLCSKSRHLQKNHFVQIDGSIQRPRGKPLSRPCWPFWGPHGVLLVHPFPKKWLYVGKTRG